LSDIEPVEHELIARNDDVEDMEDDRDRAANDQASDITLSGEEVIDPSTACDEADVFPMHH